MINQKLNLFNFEKVEDLFNDLFEKVKSQENELGGGEV